MILKLALLITMLYHVDGAEWMTSGGHHCTERCQVSTRVIGGEELDNVYTCPVVNGVSLEHVAAGHSESGRPNSDYDDPEDRELSEDDKYFWDWCTPSVTEELDDSDQNDDDDELGPMDPAPLPDTGFNPGSGGGEGFSGNRNPGNSGYNPGSSASGVASSLYGVKCEGACREISWSNQYKCSIPEGSFLSREFYCSPAHVPIPRTQVSSRKKLWCIGDCVSSGSNGYYQCRTMFGYDLCSPSRDMSSSGRRCHGSCEEDPQDDQQHYKCFVNDMRTEMEHCGAYADTLPDAVTHAVQYSNDGKVCAGLCQDWNGDKRCEVVSWTWDEDSLKADLELSDAACGPETNRWRDIGIIIGCVLAAIAIIGVVTFIVVKKKYDRVSTTG